MLERIEARRPEGWLQMSLMLRNLDFDAQVAFEKEFRRIKERISASTTRRKRRDCVIVESGPQKRRSVIIGYAYKDIARELRNERIKNIAGNAMAEACVERATVIGVNVSEPIYPYNIIAVMERGQSEG